MERTSESESTNGSAASAELKRKMEEVSQSAKDAAQIARAGAEAKLEEVRKANEKQLDAIRERVVSEPVKSLGIAAGVGCLVGMLLFRRH